MRAHGFLAAFGPIIIACSSSVEAEQGEGELVVLDLRIDVERLGRTPTKEEERELLDRADAALHERLGLAEIHPVQDREIGAESLRIRSPEANGYTRERLIRHATMSSDLQFQVVAVDSDLTASGTSLRAERARLDKWLEGDARGHLSVFARLLRDEGGPVEGLVWAWHTVQLDEPGEVWKEPLPLLVQQRKAWRFGTTDLADVRAVEDMRELTAIEVEIEAGRAHSFEEFTGAHVGRLLVMALGDEVLAAITIRDALPAMGSFSRRLGFARQEAEDIAAVLGTPLDVPLEVVGKKGD